MGNHLIPEGYVSLVTWLLTPLESTWIFVFSVGAFKTPIDSDSVWILAGVSCWQASCSWMCLFNFGRCAEVNWNYTIWIYTIPSIWCEEIGKNAFCLQKTQDGGGFFDKQRKLNSESRMYTVYTQCILCIHNFFSHLARSWFQSFCLTCLPKIRWCVQIIPFDIFDGQL